MTSPDYRFRWNNYKHPNLVAAFDMSTLSAGKMKNLTGDSTYDATINGTLVLANPLIKAKKTKSMLFDGSTNYLSVPAFPATPNGSIVIMYESTTNWPEGIIDFDPVGNTRYLYGYDAGVGTTSLRYQTVVGAIDAKGNDQAPRTGTIKMMGLSHDRTNNQARLFSNGRLLTNTSPLGVGAINFLFNNVLIIGQCWVGFIAYHTGRIDNILIYNTVLTPNQHWSIFRSSVPR